MRTWEFKNKNKFWLLFLLVIVFFILSCCIGRYPLTISDIYSILSGNVDSEVAATLFYQIRLPRTVLVLLCGGALSLSGLVLQTIFRNPLVAPDVLGVSNGCCVGAVFAILYGNTMSIQTLSFLCGLFAVFSAMLLSKAMKGNPVLSMILSGIVIGSISSSLLMALKLIADPDRKLPVIEFWLMGGFYTASWENVITVFPLIMLASIVLYVLRLRLKVLSLGDEQAQSLGVDVKMIRLISILCATILVSTVVSVAGVVSWIGLIAPHIVRIYAGEDIITTFSLSFFCGSSLLLFADIVSRTLFPVELPISILTSLLGAGFLFLIVFRKR